MCKRLRGIGAAVLALGVIASAALAFDWEGPYNTTTSSTEASTDTTPSEHWETRGGIVGWSFNDGTSNSDEYEWGETENDYTRWQDLARVENYPLENQTDVYHRLWIHHWDPAGPGEHTVWDGGAPSQMLHVFGYNIPGLNGTPNFLQAQWSTPERHAQPVEDTPVKVTAETGPTIDPDDISTKNTTAVLGLP